MKKLKWTKYCVKSSTESKDDNIDRIAKPNYNKNVSYIAVFQKNLIVYFHQTQSTQLSHLSPALQVRIGWEYLSSGYKHSLVAEARSLAHSDRPPSESHYAGSLEAWVFQLSSHLVQLRFQFPHL